MNNQVKTKYLAEWRLAKANGIYRRTFESRIRRGWKPLRAATTPAARKEVTHE